VGVVLGLDDHGHARVVLGGAAHHGRAADVDLLDDLGAAAARLDRLLERVGGPNHQLERRGLVMGELITEGCQVLAGQDSPVPPGATISAPASWRARARSTIPVWSKTETRARRMGRRSVVVT